MHRGVRVEGARDALELTHHLLGGFRVAQHKVDRSHALSVQTCDDITSLSQLLFPVVNGTRAHFPQFFYSRNRVTPAAAARPVLSGTLRVYD